MKVEMIAVGNEVVYGHVVNTNASYIARQIQLLGMTPQYMSAICDEVEAIKAATHLAIKRADVIIFTGGLGPTPDDLTKEAVCEALGLETNIIPEELEHLKAYFRSKHRTMTSNNEKQAAFPKEAIILPNSCGTAPGCLIESNGKKIILLPGPPKEMKSMFEMSVMPYLKKWAKSPGKHLDIKCFGIGESELAYLIEPFLGEKDQVNVATYINEGEVIVRLTAIELDEKKAQEAIEKLRNNIEVCLKPYIFGYNQDKLEEKVVECLLEKKWSIATVESCTGGLIAGTLINCNGVSACLNESIVTYSNEAKMKYVGVKKETLLSVGAVSEETAKEMAEGIRRQAHAYIGLSSTGIAGPGGGTSEKPVGLVYIGIATEEDTQVFKLQLSGTRQEVRQKTVKNILFQLLKKLQ